MKQSNGLAIVSLILGIVGIVLSFIPIINNGAFFIGIIAVIFGIIGLVKKEKKGLSIAGLILGILAVVITLGMQSAASKAIDDATSKLDKTTDDATGENTEDILKNDVQVDIGAFTADSDEYGITTTTLPVTVTNISKEKHSFSIQIECVDGDGNRITDDYVTVNDLAAGQSIDEKAFQYVEDDKLDSVKTGTFKIVEVDMY